VVIAQPSGGVKRRLTAHRHFNLHQQYVRAITAWAVVEARAGESEFSARSDWPLGGGHRPAMRFRGAVSCGRTSSAIWPSGCGVPRAVRS
jgi:hypothetical protein